MTANDGNRDREKGEKKRKQENKKPPTSRTLASDIAVQCLLTIVPALITWKKKKKFGKFGQQRRLSHTRDILADAKRGSGARDRT